MITRFNKFKKNSELYEYYTGNYKAAGFKHYQETGFSLILYFGEEDFKEFEENIKKFINRMKRLGVEASYILDDKSYIVIVVFPAVNNFEAMSISEQVSTWLKNKKIKFTQASITFDIGKHKQIEDLVAHSKDITTYLKRKDHIANKINPKVASFMTQAYKDSKIGF